MPQSGNGTFTGPNTVNPTKLFIPDKDKMDPVTAKMARLLEQFINSLNKPPSGGGGTFYASLTGAGETTTPGALTQLGDFTVTTSGPNGVTFNTTGGVNINDNGTVGFQVNTNGVGGIYLFANSSAVDISANTSVSISANTTFVTSADTMVIQTFTSTQIQSPKLGFFTTTPVAQPGPATGWTVAQVISGLQALGLFS